MIGRAGSGKTTRFLDEIREQLLRREDGPPLIMLVPEQATFQTEYSLASSPGLTGTLRAQTLSFRRLAFRVMQDTGGTARVHIDDTGKKMLLHNIIRRRKSDLRLFQQADGQMGVLDRINEMFSEFKRYRITPELLEEYLCGETTGSPVPETGMLQDKLHDLSLIYNDFEAALSKHYVDSEDYLTLLAGQIGRSAYLRDAEVWIDGFHGFTPQEFEVVGQLMKACRRVSIALCLDKDYQAWDKPHELDLFYPTASTLVRLKQLAEEFGIASDPAVLLDASPPPRYAASPELAHLERGFERRSKWSGPVAPKPQISVHAAVHRRAEVEGAAKEILRLVRDEHYRWRDLAVTVRNAEGYGDLISAVFRDYGIPHFFDRKRTVSHHPLIELIRSALETVNGGWRYDSVFRCVKTDFFLPFYGEREEDLLLGEEEFVRIGRNRLDLLENYVLSVGIQGGKWTDSERWTYRLLQSLDADNEQQDDEAEQFLQEIHALRWRVAGPLLELQKALRAAEDVRGMAEALFVFLQSLRVPERLERWSRQCVKLGQAEKAREHAGIWGSVLDVLDQIVEMMGGETIGAELFGGMLEAGLDSIRLGLVPPALDQVLIGSVDRTRSSRIKICFMLGVNDGVLPSRIEEDGVINEKEREQLQAAGLQLAPGSRRRLMDEQFLIYTVLASPSDRLWLSYPLADEEGRALLPSEIIRQVKTMFPASEGGMLVADPSAEEHPDGHWRFVSHPERALSHLMNQLRQWKRGTPLPAVWRELYNWFQSRPEWRDKLQALMSSLFYENRELPLSPETSLLLYGERLRASVSRMEMFVACPFAHFASYGLGLRERKIHRLEAPDIGQLFHAALSMIAMDLQRENLSWGQLSPAACRQRAETAVDRLSPKLQSEILFSSGRYQYMARKLKEIVGRASVVLGEHARRSGFAPVGLEIPFGQGQPIPPLTFPLDNGATMELIGRIDRIDRADTEQGVLLRVIDYKSSAKALRLAEVYYGLSLQMPAYLDVAVTNADKWLGTKAIPAGALYFHVHNPILSLPGVIPQEEAEAKLFKQFKMKGLVLADRGAVSLMDTHLEKGHSELIPVALTANGQFYKNSSVITLEEWDKLKGHVRKVIRGVGRGIAEGRVDIQPYRYAAKTACSTCSYQSVCQFDPQYEGNGYKFLRVRSKEEIWNLIGSGAEEEPESGLMVKPIFQRRGEADEQDT